VGEGGNTRQTLREEFTSGVENVSDHGTIGPRKCFEFPESISPRKIKRLFSVKFR
jgi:hypothetical protein